MEQPSWGGAETSQWSNGSQSCAPTDLRRRQKTWGSMRAACHIVGRRGGGNEESKEKDQREARMARLGFLKHDTRGVNFRD